MVEVSRHTNLSEFVNFMNVFHNVHSTLYTVTKAHSKAKPRFYWSYQCFFVVKMVAGIQRIWKKIQKIETPKQYGR